MLLSLKKYYVLRKNKNKTPILTVSVKFIRKHTLPNNNF